VYTPKEIVATCFGFLNILLWLVAQIPQIVENYKRKSVEVPVFPANACILD
jgi:hypothetical protein